MDKDEFKRKVIRLLDGGGCYGGLYVDQEDQDIIVDEFWEIMTFNIAKFTEEQIKEGLNKAYKEAGHNAYFGEGFKAGIEFASQLKQLK